MRAPHRRVDGNHAEAVKALRQIGATAFSTASLGNGVPDLVCGYRGITMLIELKNEDATRGDWRKLTADEQRFHETWAGSVVIVATSPADAVLRVVEAARPAVEA